MHERFDRPVRDIGMHIPRSYHVTAPPVSFDREASLADAFDRLAGRLSRWPWRSPSDEEVLRAMAHFVLVANPALASLEFVAPVQVLPEGTATDLRRLAFSRAVDTARRAVRVGVDGIRIDVVARDGRPEPTPGGAG